MTFSPPKRFLNWFSTAFQHPPSLPCRILAPGDPEVPLVNRESLGLGFVACPQRFRKSIALRPPEDFASGYLHFGGLTYSSFFGREKREFHSYGFRPVWIRSFSPLAAGFPFSAPKEFFVSFSIPSNRSWPKFVGGRGESFGDPMYYSFVFFSFCVLASSSFAQSTGRMRRFSAGSCDFFCQLSKLA